MSTSDFRATAGSSGFDARAFAKPDGFAVDDERPPANLDPHGVGASLSILYIGKRSGTSLDRIEALCRLGHQVEVMDLRCFLPKTPWVDRVTWRLGGQCWTPWISRSLRRALDGRHFDICYVDGGDLLTPSGIRSIRKHALKVVNYCIDDPLGGRDGARATAYKRSLPFYDLCIVMRQKNVDEAIRLGARRVHRVHMSADERSHAPRVLTEEDRRSWQSDVLFIGTWFPERGPLLLELVERGVPVTLRGANWNKAPEWPKLRKLWRGGALVGDDYAKAIQCAKVNIGLLSKGNRDQHTTRSLEIPALGGLLCAERTPEHLAMYEEGREALFWGDVAECARACQYALDDEPRRQAIAAAGRRRALSNQYFNEPVLREIIAQLGSLEN